jgi:hypothetical protein
MPDNPRDPIEAAVRAYCDWDVSIKARCSWPECGCKTIPEAGIRVAIVAYEAAAWCDDMASAPKSDISAGHENLTVLLFISNGRRVLGWRDADYEPSDPEYDHEDCEFYDMNNDGIEPSPTHWRLPPAGPVT